MDKEKNIIIICASGHGKVVASTALAAGFTILGFYDDNPELIGKKVLNIPVLGTLSNLESAQDFQLAVIALGDNTLRAQIAHRFTKLKWATLVHPQAYVDNTAELGEGTVIFAGSVIQPVTRVGRHCIVNTASSVDHDSTIGDFVHIAPGSHLGGHVILGDHVFLGVGVSVIPKVEVGSKTWVGAGSTVIDNLASDGIAVGSPAKMIKHQNEKI
jgi:sugar O-acyltransferase (sialic acid O-acetyltransferase NeuD family)